MTIFRAPFPSAPFATVGTGSRSPAPTGPDPGDDAEGAWESAAQPFRAGRAGITLAEAERLRRDGLVRPLIGDVLVAAACPDSRALRAAAAALLLPLMRSPDPGWAVGFETALWVHTGWSPQAVPAELHLVVPPGRHRPSRAGVRRRQVRLSPADIGALHGLPVTTPVRTAADVSRDLPAAQVTEALQRLRRCSGVRPEDVLDQLAVMASARGVRAARAHVQAWADRW